jgi:hypothetical protein
MERSLRMLSVQELIFVKEAYMIKAGIPDNLKIIS